MSDYSVDFRQVSIAFDFYDGSGVAEPSARSSNRIRFRTPVLRPFQDE
jgi:hypothetical protein